MNLVDKLEKALANRRWIVEGDDEDSVFDVFDALPALLKVVRAVQNTDTRCLFRYRNPGDPCGSCVMCVLRAALDPLISPLEGEPRAEEAEAKRRSDEADRTSLATLHSGLNELEAFLKSREHLHRMESDARHVRGGGTAAARETDAREADAWQKALLLLTAARVRNPHNCLHAVDETNISDTKRWKCHYCHAEGTYDELLAIECSYVYPPCEICGQTPLCAEDCGEKP